MGSGKRLKRAGATDDNHEKDKHFPTSTNSTLNADEVIESIALQDLIA